MAAKETPSVNLSTLPIPQLNSIKNQLTQELQHLTSSFTQLRAAQAKFRDCINSIRDGIQKGDRKEGMSAPLALSGIRGGSQGQFKEDWNAEKTCRNTYPRAPDPITLRTWKARIYRDSPGGHRHRFLR